MTFSTREKLKSWIFLEGSKSRVLQDQVDKTQSFATEFESLANFWGSRELFKLLWLWSIIVACGLILFKLKLDSSMLSNFASSTSISFNRVLKSLSSGVATACVVTEAVIVVECKSTTS